MIGEKILRPSNILDQSSLRDRTHIFKDRCEAGGLLATMLAKKLLEDSVVLAIPSGGVPVGFCISRQLKIPLDIVVVRKLPIPWNPESGFGAVALDGSVVLNKQLVHELGLDEETISTLAASRLREIRERLAKFRGRREPTSLHGKEVILVDDGLASGFTMLAAIRFVKREEPREVVVAVPTGHDEALRRIFQEVDEVYCLNVRSGMSFAVADAYINWYDVGDVEVQRYLVKAWEES